MIASLIFPSVARFFGNIQKNIRPETTGRMRFRKEVSVRFLKRKPEKVQRSVKRVGCAARQTVGALAVAGQRHIVVAGRFVDHQSVQNQIERTAGKEIVHRLKPEPRENLAAQQRLDHRAFLGCARSEQNVDRVQYKLARRAAAAELFVAVRKTGIKRGNQIIHRFVVAFGQLDAHRFGFRFYRFARAVQRDQYVFGQNALDRFCQKVVRLQTERVDELVGVYKAADVVFNQRILHAAIGVADRIVCDHLFLRVAVAGCDAGHIEFFDRSAFQNHVLVGKRDKAVGKRIARKRRRVDVIDAVDTFVNGHVAQMVVAGKCDADVPFVKQAADLFIVFQRIKIVHRHFQRIVLHQLVMHHGDDLFAGCFGVFDLRGDPREQRVGNRAAAAAVPFVGIDRQQPVAVFQIDRVGRRGVVDRQRFVVAELAVNFAELHMIHRVGRYVVLHIHVVVAVDDKDLLAGLLLKRRENSGKGRSILQAAPVGQIARQQQTVRVGRGSVFQKPVHNQRCERSQLAERIARVEKPVGCDFLVVSPMQVGRNDQPQRIVLCGGAEHEHAAKQRERHQKTKDFFHGVSQLLVFVFRFFNKEQVSPPDSRWGSGFASARNLHTSPRCRVRRSSRALPLRGSDRCSKWRYRPGGGPRSCS